VFTTIRSDECDEVALLSSRERSLRTRSPSLVISHHASERFEQRHIDHWAIRIAIAFGEWFHAGKGCEVAYVSRRAIKAAASLLGGRCSAVENLAVVVSNDGVVLTAYRTKRPLKHWRGGS
jgi:hypothetical protein